MIAFGFVIIVAIWMLWWVVRTSTFNTVHVGGTPYKVQPTKNKREAKKAARMLHTLTQRLQRFIDEARDVYPDDPRIDNLHKRWSGTLAEVGHGDDIAYSLNKRSIHICIRQENGRIEDPQVAMYVLLHEAAHVATDTYGHTKTFWKNFQFLLELSEKLGVYRYQDFTHKATTYCGHKLGKNVMHCVKHQQCSSVLP